MNERPLPDDHRVQSVEERPPGLRTWGRWYGVILAELVLLVLAFRLIMVFFG